MVLTSFIMLVPTGVCFHYSMSNMLFPQMLFMNAVKPALPHHSPDHHLGVVMFMPVSIFAHDSADFAGLMFLGLYMPSDGG